jgi:putative iron-dependent peroxidase
MIPQPGIFAQGTRSQYHLEFDVRPDATTAELAAAVGALREPTVTSGGTNLVIGFGPELARRTFPDDAPADLAPFAGVEGAPGRVPATPHDLWVWLHGTGPDVLLDNARCVVDALAPVARLMAEQPCFVYLDSRDLTGFIDGTENPPVQEAAAVALVPPGRPGTGGAHVITIRWIHDLAAFHALEVDAQEAVIGRTKPDSVDLEERKSPTAHIARVVVEDDVGEELEIYRRSTPYGTVGERGLYFVAFSAEPSRFEIMLGRMFGTTDDGLHDRLMDFTQAVSGAYYFAPSLEILAGLGE